MISRKGVSARVRMVIVLIVLGLILAFLEKTGSFNFPKNVLASVFTPVQLALYRTYQNVSQVGSGFASIASLRKENTELELENAKLTADNSRLGQLEAENRLLREQLAAPKLELKLTQIANVIGFGTAGNRNNLLLDKGSNDKVKVGDLAVIRNIYLGRVSEVQAKTCRIQLITDSATKIPAYTSAGALGVVVGQFGTEAHLSNVIQDDKLTKEDLVMTSGEAGFPKGLVIGKLSEVKKVSRELFQDATVEPLVDLSKLQTVFLMEQK